ncbi:UNVERIFIED_CONTAM: yfcH [Trichonephila clavipes]
MALNPAVIKIKNLRLRTYIGINEDEIKNKQDVVINARIQYSAEAAANSDEMDKALNYRTITKQIIALVENNRFALLEKLTADVLALASAHPSVSYAEVEVDKPHALRFADSIKPLRSAAMRILLTGGTGLIGSALLKHWQNEHQLTVLTRTVRPGSSAVQYITDLAKVDFNQLDAVINLAGEPIADKRWTDAQKDQICQSRWQLTEQLVQHITAASTPPAVLISGSAIGFYGRQGEQEISEEYQAFFPEFSHDICARWENLAWQANSPQTRVCLIRTGVVLAANGGALKKMLLPFKLGLGGKIGSGDQYMSWIHLDDMVALIDFLLHNDQISGAVNATAPKPVTNAIFSTELAKRLKRPALLPMPAPVLKLLFGEMSDILLYGQRVIPKKLLDAGFQFRYPNLQQALAALAL